MNLSSLKERVEHQFITQSQADTITEYEKNKPTYRNFQVVVGLLGVIFIGAGVIFYFAANWDYLSDIFKTIFLLTTMILTYIAGFRVQEKTKYQKRGYAILFLGNILYGANIFLLGQVYNLGGTYYEGFGLWSLGTLLFAYLMNHTLSFFLGIITFFARLIPRLTTENIIFDGGIIFICTAIGFLFLSVSNLHQDTYKPIGLLYRFLGIIILYTSFLFFTHGLEIYIPYAQEINGLRLVPGIFVGAGIIKLCSYYFVEEKNFSNNLRNIAYLIHFILLAGFYFYIVTQQTIDGNTNFYNPGNNLFSILLINIYFGIMVLYSAYHSAQNGQTTWLNIQMIFLVIYSMIQYISIFGGLLNGGIFFISTGIFLFAISFVVEKLRRRLVNSKNTPIT